MSPQRIQRKRTKGWRMPEGAVYVGRPSRWGNPWSLKDWAYLTPHVDEQRELAVACFRQMLDEQRRIVFMDPEYPTDLVIRNHLAGKDLACWCPLEDEHGNRVPCHADVLLEIANRGVAQ